MTFTLLESRSQLTPQTTPFAEWMQADGGCAASFYRLSSGYLVRFPGLADFELSTDALTIDCYPVPRVNEMTCRNLYTNQILPLALSRRGALVFHASAVEMPSGKAAIFAGRSGSGKSTLAAAFAIAGCRFLSDDGSVVEADGEGYRTLPSQSWLRLCQDSQRALVGPGAGGTSTISARSKTRVEAEGRIQFCPQPRPLSSIYVLGDADVSTARFERLAPSKALIELVKHCFVLDPCDPSLLTSQFERLSRLVERVACFRLGYARRFERLNALCRAIMEHRATDGRMS